MHLVHGAALLWSTSAAAGHADLLPRADARPAWRDRLAAEAPPAALSPPPLPTPARATVYGYHPYWGVDPTRLDFDRLTHLAVFAVEIEASGALSRTANWTDVAPTVVPLAHAAGVRVHLTVISFDDDVHAAVLPDAGRRGVAVAQLAQLVEDYGADGVNVDIEGLDEDLRDELVLFTRELKAALPPGQDDIVHATPAVDWSDAYAYDELCALGDLFIMGYGYHWTGGDPGPNAPLWGDAPWSQWSLSWSVDDYRAVGAPDDCIILGLPTYGQEWPVADVAAVPGDATGTGWSVTTVNAVAIAEAEGRAYDAGTETAYVLRSGTQLWYDDTASLEPKIRYAVDEGLQGVGFWALGYEGDDPAFWQMVEEATALPDGGDSGTADGGTGEGGASDGGADGGDDSGRPPLGGRGTRVEEPGGCATAPAAGGLLLVLAALVGRRRA